MCIALREEPCRREKSHIGRINQVLAQIIISNFSKHWIWPFSSIGKELHFSVKIRISTLIKVMFDFFLAKCFVGTTKLIYQEWCFLQNLSQKGKEVEWHQLKEVVKGSNTIKLFEEFLIESVLPFCRLLEANSMLFVSPSALIGRHCAWFQSFISLLSWSAYSVSDKYQLTWLLIVREPWV